MPSRASASADATLTGALGPIGFAVSGSRTDSVSGLADLMPQASVRWNSGVHNWMTYITGNIPIGAYDSARLINLGIGHQALKSSPTPARSAAKGSCRATSKAALANWVKVKNPAAPAAPAATRKADEDWAGTKKHRSRPRCRARREGSERPLPCSTVN